MTIIDVFGDAVKIGLGALIAGVFSHLNSKKNHEHDLRKSKESHFLALQADLKTKCVAFSEMSSRIVHKYRFITIDDASEDFSAYRQIYCEIQIIGSHVLQAATNKTFNSVIKFASLNKNYTEPEHGHNESEKLILANKDISKFLGCAQQEVLKSYNHE